MSMVLGTDTTNNRLFREFRGELGLAYSIWGGVFPRIRVRGTFQIGGETKYETLPEALKVILRHVRNLREREATDEEIRVAKDYLDHSLPFQFSSSAEIAERSMWYEYYGMPADWLFVERDRVLAATKRDVLRVARAHLDPKALIMLIVGDPAKCRKGLEKFGPVRELQLPDGGA